MLLGLIQTAPQFGAKKTNRQEIEALARNKRADLWLMPELALTGYEFHDRKEAAELAEEIPNGETTKWLLQFCHDRDCFAVVGLPERSGDKVYNSAILAGPQGLVGHYRKLHLFDFEMERFDPGDLPFSVYDIGVAKIGLMICFDWRFPEAARTLTLRGAQILAHPSNLVMPYCQRAMVTRALENRVFCATVNRIGTEERNGKAVTFTGGSQIVSPDGRTVLSLPTDKAVCLIAEINPVEADNKKATQHNDVIGGSQTGILRTTNLNRTFKGKRNDQSRNHGSMGFIFI